MKCVARKGTIVSFGNASGAVPPLSVLSLSPKNVKVLRPILFNYIHTPEEWEYYSTRLFEYLESGKIKISISKIYPLSEFKQALTDLTGGKTTGKLIVETK
jgi:NADPH2:quinone reductase